MATCRTDRVILGLCRPSRRWRMVSLSIIFAAIPAVIYLAVGLPVTVGTVTIGTLIAFTTL
jgi:ATP-binding cassette, subfamily B, bacterial